MTSRSPIVRLVTAAAVFALFGSSVSCSTVGDLVSEGRDQLDRVKEQAPASPSGRERPQRPTGTIAVSPFVMVASQVVEPSGGSITVSTPGHALNGMAIEIPAGSYAATAQWNVSSATVLEHSFGAHFNPVSPLIMIENGGNYADELITVRIPVEVPSDHFAMAFYYDADAGTLEGIPSSAQDADSITIVTRHFSKLLVSIIKNSVLDDLLKKGIDSGFRPGGDDWQFVNRGSYIAPGGHCAGQCLTALWYYCERPDGADPFLWSLYDNNGDKPATPDLWEDDSHGYRLASTIQEDIHWTSFENKFMYYMRGGSDELAFKAFAYSMSLTGEPQQVGIYSNAGGGHAMIVYRLDTKGLAIADPNYPGSLERRVEYADGKFSPYNSGANADEIAAGNGKAYESIQYFAKTAMVDWNILAQRWEEFKDGTIGNDRFPEYAISTVDSDGNEIPLVDGYESQSERIDISVSSTSAPIGIRVYRDGVRLPTDDDGLYPLVEGNSRLGIDIWGDVSNDPQNRRYKYIDFQYINVWSGPKETTGCNGWALESVIPDWAPKEKQFGDQYETDYVFSATDGSFSATGRKWIGAEVYQRPWNAWVLFSHQGTWTPLPACVPFGETTTITLKLDNPVLGIDGTPEDEGYWGPMTAYLYVNINDGDGTYLDDPGLVRASSTTLEGSTESQLVEFNLTELAYGNPEEGAVIEVAVWFGALNGEGCYRYKYVYHG